MRKQHIFVYFFYFIFCSKFFAQTELEILWNKCVEKNYEILKETNDYEYSKLEYKSMNTLYPFALSINMDSSFSDFYNNISSCPTDVAFNVSLTKYNPAGNTIKTSLDYSLNRDFLNFFDEIDYKNIGYAQNPILNLYIYQSLNPYFFQKEKKDPNKSILQNNIKLNEISKEKIIEDYKEMLSSYYIQYRYYKRLLEIKQYYLNYYEECLILENEKLLKQQTSISNLWNIENSKYESYKEYISYKNNIELLENNIRILCGDIDNLSITENLPQIFENTVNYDVKTEEIILQMENLRLSKIITNQKSAPFISINGNFKEKLKTKDSFIVNYIKDKNFFSWNFSLGITFDEFFSASTKLRDDKYEKSIEYLNSKLGHIKNETRQKEITYEKLISIYEKQLYSANFIHNTKKQSFVDTEKLYVRGLCSKIDLEFSKICMLESQYLLENINDNLWLYKWKKSQLYTLEFN